MDLNKIAEEGKVDYEQDFFKKPVSLTVSGQHNICGICAVFLLSDWFGT